MNKIKLLAILTTAIFVFSSCDKTSSSVGSIEEGLSLGEENTTSSAYATAYSKAEETLTLQANEMNTNSFLFALENGNIIYEKGFGYLDKATQQSWKSSSLTNIGSVSKLFVTASILKLQQDNKLELSAPIINYLTDFKMKDERYKDITVHMLLNHSSGLPGTKYDDAFLYEKDTNKNYYQKLLSDLSEESLKANPGEYPVYCNEGFILAQKIVETLSGMDYESFINSELLLPMDIDPVYLSANPNIPLDDFVPFVDSTETITPREVVIKDFAGTGGLTMNAKTLALFGDRILSLENSVLNEESRALFRENQSQFSSLGDNTTFNGLGWDYVEYPYGNLPVYTKSGGTMNYLSQIIVAPEHNIVIVGFSTNPSTIGAVVETLLKDILIEQGAMKKNNINSVASLSAEEITPELLEKQGKYSIIGGALAFDIVITENQLTMPFVPLSKIGNEAGSISYLYEGNNTFSSPETDGKIEKFSFEEINGKNFIIQHFISEYANYKVAYAQRIEPEESFYQWENLNNTIWMKNNINKNSMAGMQDMISSLSVDSSTTGFVTFVRNTPFLTVSENMALSVNETARDSGNLIIKDEDTISFRKSDYTNANTVTILNPESLENLVVPEEENTYWFKAEEEQNMDLLASYQEFRVVVFDENLVPIFDNLLNSIEEGTNIPQNSYIMISNESEI